MQVQLFNIILLVRYEAERRSGASARNGLQ